jgi:hypothetical protein
MGAYIEKKNNRAILANQQILEKYNGFKDTTNVQNDQNITKHYQTKFLLTKLKDI